MIRPFLPFITQNREPYLPSLSMCDRLDLPPQRRVGGPNLRAWFFGVRLHHLSTHAHGLCIVRKRTSGLILGPGSPRMPGSATLRRNCIAGSMASTTFPGWGRLIVVRQQAISSDLLVFGTESHPRLRVPGRCRFPTPTFKDHQTRCCFSCRVDDLRSSSTSWRRMAMTGHAFPLQNAGGRWSKFLGTLLFPLHPRLFIFGLPLRLQIHQST